MRQQVKKCAQMLAKKDGVFAAQMPITIYYGQGLTTVEKKEHKEAIQDTSVFFKERNQERARRKEQTEARIKAKNAKPQEEL